jgi:multicomponent Na+:H+ antiporter subunit F
MSAWMFALLALLPAFAVPVLAALRGEMEGRFVAAQLAVAIAIPVLVVMTFAFDQSALIDLGLTLALLSLPGTLLVAIFVERWL